MDTILDPKGGEDDPGLYLNPSLSLPPNPPKNSDWDKLGWTSWERLGAHAPPSPLSYATDNRSHSSLLSCYSPCNRYHRYCQTEDFQYKLQYISLIQVHSSTLLKFQFISRTYINSDTSREPCNTRLLNN